jgi:hypothetical protein
MSRIITALFFCISSLFLTACSSFMSEPPAIPIKVELDKPQEVIQGGVHLDAPGQTWDGYGEVVDIDEDVLVIGASEWNPCGPGSAFVYRFEDGTWQEEARLAASDREIFTAQARPFEAQRFGSSVAVADGTIAIGAPGNASPADGGYTGAVYLFEYDGQGWIETTKLAPGQPGLETLQTKTDPSLCRRMKPRTFGALAALDGDILAVGGDSSTNSVYIYQRGENGWSEQARMSIPGLPERELTMASMDLFGDTLALSALYTPPQTETDLLLPGKVIVYIFERNGDAWGESFRFTPEEGEVDLLFLPEVNVGASVALSGEADQANLLAIGLPGFPDWTGDLDPSLIGVDADKPEFPESYRKAGGVYTFERGETGGWKPQAILKPAGWDNPPGPGSMISMTSSPTQKAAFVFPGDLYSADPEISYFGATLDLDMDRLAVTAGFANATYVFERQRGNWAYRFRIIPTRVSEGSWEDYAHIAVVSGCSLLLGTPGEFGDSAYVFDLCG